MRLLLVPSFTELEWGIRPQLEEWAEVATFDMPGVGGSPLPRDLMIDPEQALESLARWRVAGAERGLSEVDRLGWEQFVVVTDGHGAQTAIRLAQRRRDSVVGLALGHASLSSSTEGERPPMRPGIWDALVQLARQGSEPFVRYGIAQMTRGGYTEEVAAEMLTRFPDMDLVTAMLEALVRDPEPIGDDLAALDLPLLLAKHEGCLGRTDEGYDDIVAAFPQAQTARCPETCTASPAFAEAVMEFCDALSARNASLVTPDE